MEKIQDREAFEQEQSGQEDTLLDVNKLSPEQLQSGIEATLQAAIKQFLGRVIVLEQFIKKPVDIKFNTKLTDGRKLHIRLTPKKDLK